MKNNLQKFILFFIVLFSVFFLLPQKVYKKKIYNFNALVDLKYKNSNQPGKIEAYCNTGKTLKLVNFTTGVVGDVVVSGNKYIYANNIFYIIYDEPDGKVEIYSLDNKLISSLSAPGYPYIPENSSDFIVIKKDGLGFSIISNNGKKVFDDINFTSMIVSISMDDIPNILVSTIDGYTYIYSKKGEIIFESSSKESKYNIAKSNVIDAQSKIFAFCYGLYPEYVEVRRLKNNKKILKLKTGTNFRYKNILLLEKNMLYYEALGGIAARSIFSGKKFFYGIKGEVSEVKIDSFNNLIIASAYKDIFLLTIYSKSGDIIYQNEFKEPVDNINIYQDRFIYFRVADDMIRLAYGENA